MTATAVPDQHQRDRIATDLGCTLFVEAGAGSGKTTALVDRVVRLVDAGTELRSIAAITFTEKAGAELRDRLRTELEKRAAAETADPERAERLRVAADQIDAAAIGTLHSFAQRVLTENPVEAGLPPRVEVLDELSSDVEFERRWTVWRDRLLEDPAMEQSLLLFFATGVPETSLRVLAVAFDLNWDLVEARVPATAPDPPSVAEILAPALAKVDELCRYRDAAAPDLLTEKLNDIATFAERLRGIDDDLDLLEALDQAFPKRLQGPSKPTFKFGNAGGGENWGELKGEIRTCAEETRLALVAVFDRVGQACAHRIAAELRSFTLEAADARRAAGRVSFHDLLVLSRSLVTSPQHGAAVRRRLHERYTHLLLDEFQDTDPIQIELAVRIAAAEPESDTAGTAPWEDVEVAPGHLFFVGDPKQSIYRFRRADISLFIQAQKRYRRDDGQVTLSANFRTVAPVIDWVNAVFDPLLSEESEIDLPVPSQPEYQALEAVRESPPVGPAVSVLGRAALGGGNADEVRTIEARAVAATAVRALQEGWSVGTGDAGDPWRPARLGDITILLPARTSLGHLEDALDELHVPFRAESSSLVYASRPVRDLLMALRAADDPTDQLAVVSALRSPLFACGDDDLYRFKVEQRGHWNHTAPQPDSVAPGRVADGIAYLAAIHRARHWSSPAELLDRIARDRRSFELGFTESRSRDVWRRLRFVIDQARSWSETTPGTTRDYLAWVTRQTAEGARVAESVLPETDDDAVRIMTIHASKGLEFPITIVSGTSTKPQSRRAPAEVAFPPATDTVAYRFGSNITTEEWADWKPVDEQMAVDERIRLLYVACTRAQDHLVVSLHRTERANPASRSSRTHAEQLVHGMGELLATLPDAEEGDIDALPFTPLVAPDAPAPYPEWRRELDEAVALAARPTTVAATALTDSGDPDVAPEPELATARSDAGDHEMGGSTSAEPDAGLRKRPRDLDLPPWLKGRYGTAVGRAVHGVLQTVDLATGDGLDAAVAAQCQAEAIPDRADTVAALARAALASPTVAEAATRPHWREIYACTPVADGRLLEGYVDLLYRAANGLVVVDHKTAATSDTTELDRRVEGYRLQGASYALAIGRTTGEPVVRVVFVFLTPEGAIERELTDVDAAIADVERLVAAGREILVAEGQL